MLADVRITLSRWKIEAKASRDQGDRKCHTTHISEQNRWQEKLNHGKHESSPIQPVTWFEGQSVLKNYVQATVQKKNTERQFKFFESKDVFN
jgi:hypothetical protein